MICEQPIEFISYSGGIAKYHRPLEIFHLNYILKTAIICLAILLLVICDLSTQEQICSHILEGEKLFATETDSARQNLFSLSHLKSEYHDAIWAMPNRMHANNFPTTEMKNNQLS